MAASLRNPFRVEQIIAPATQGSRCASTLGYHIEALRAIAGGWRDVQRVALAWVVS